MYKGVNIDKKITIKIRRKNMLKNIQKCFHFVNRGCIMNATKRKDFLYKEGVIYEAGE